MPGLRSIGQKSESSKEKIPKKTLSDQSLDQLEKKSVSKEPESLVASFERTGNNNSK